MREIFLSILENYHSEKNKSFKNNDLANKIRKEFTEELRKLVKDEGDRYILEGSPGRGNWANCPWFAIFDSIKTTHARSGYYLVYIFREDMKGLYLCLSQGVTEISKIYKKDDKIVLVTRANDYRNRLLYNEKDNIEIDLNSNLSLPRLYEKGTILARYYDKANFPDNEVLKKDFADFLSYYKQLVYNDDTDFAIINSNSNEELVEESKQRRLHEKFDRRGNSSLKVKKRKGYTCEACGLIMTRIYGILGKEFIEAHHLKSFASLSEGKIRLNIDADFAVLCPNCHRMIHRLPDPSNLEMLKRIIEENKELIL